MIARGRNIVLIGMAGAGKSTVGVLLAKTLSRTFIDTDLVIQAAEGRRLQDILDRDGVEAFRRLEEKHILALHARGAVIATGGSVVYSGQAMAHLKADGVAVYLYLPVEALERRVTNLDSRGIVMAPGQTFTEVYRERQPLYEKHADLTIDSSGLAHDAVVDRVVAALARLPE
jgi:shikimate kinase